MFNLSSKWFDGKKPTSITRETDVGVSLQSYNLTTFSCCNAVNSFNILISLVSSVCDLAIFFFVMLFMATTLCGGCNERETITNWVKNKFHQKKWVQLINKSKLKWTNKLTLKIGMLVDAANEWKNNWQIPSINRFRLKMWKCFIASWDARMT